MNKNTPKTDGAAQDKVGSDFDVSIENEIERQIGDLIPRKGRDEVVRRLTTFVRSEFFSGPLPHPKHLSGYESILPGSADRIIAMAEKSSDHRIAVEREMVASEVRDRRLGMYMGQFSFFALVIAAFVTALLGLSWKITALFLGTAALGTVQRFIQGRQNGSD